MTTLNPTFEHAVSEALREIYGMLVGKNAAYGNSALDPVRVFSSADVMEGLRVRMDDKLSRLARRKQMEKRDMNEFFDIFCELFGADCLSSEDAHLDLIGYLVMLRIAQN
jgi:hypothetical protein